MTASNPDDLTADVELFNLLPPSFDNLISFYEDVPEEENGPCKAEGEIVANCGPDQRFRATIRCKIFTEEQAMGWVSEFEKLTLTNWTYRRNYPNATSMYRKDLACQHSNVNKHVRSANTRARGWNCKATLTIKIKRVTKGTRQGDAFVRAGYPGIIELNFVHSHPLCTVEALSYLRTLPEIKKQFHYYFNELGLGIKEARQYHRELLCARASSDHERDIMLASGADNPREVTVRNIYNKWRAELAKDVDVEPELDFENLEELEDQQEEEDDEVEDNQMELDNQQGSSTSASNRCYYELPLPDGQFYDVKTEAEGEVYDVDVDNVEGEEIVETDPKQKLLFFEEEEDEEDIETPGTVDSVPPDPRDKAKELLAEFMRVMEEKVEQLGGENTVKAMENALTQVRNCESEEQLAKILGSASKQSHHHGGSQKRPYPATGAVISSISERILKRPFTRNFV